MSLPARLLNIEGDRLRVPVSAFDIAGFRAWATSDDFPEGVRATWVEGEVFVEMSPEAIDTHNKVKVEMTAVIAQLVKEGNLGEVYGDGILFTNETAGVSTEPDLAFACWAKLKTQRVRLLPKANRPEDSVEIEGTPDLVVEIVSDSSARKDLVRLREAYLRAGIAEYWVVDARGEEVRFEILVLEGDSYRTSAPSGTPQKSAILGHSFSLTRERNPVGRWSYQLSFA
jgi:Uma2 family endonuclease